jgi:hypothetical protein
MKSFRWKMAGCALALWLAMTGAASAQAGSAARAIAKEIAEKLGQNEARELAEFGGEVVVREIVEKAIQEGGESLAKEIGLYAQKYGATSLGAFREAPAVMSAAMKKVPAELAESAMRAAAREPQAIAQLVREVGEEGLIVAAKHPGVGVKIGLKLGPEGCAVAKQLSTAEAVRLARLSDDLARVPAAARAGFLARMGKAPGKVLDYLEKHPNVLLTAAATAVSFEALDRLLGDAEAPGFVERISEKFHSPVVIVLVAVALLIFAKAAWWWTRVRRVRAGTEGS